MNIDERYRAAAYIVGGVNFDWFTSKCFRAGKEYSWLCGAFLFLFDPCG